jgi:hypothetical protein
MSYVICGSFNSISWFPQSQNGTRFGKLPSRIPVVDASKLDVTKTRQMTQTHIAYMSKAGSLSEKRTEISPIPSIETARLLDRWRCSSCILELYRRLTTSARKCMRRVAIRFNNEFWLNSVRSS